MNTKRNIIANVGGRAWAALMSFAFVPYYIAFMGIESYGLVGVFTSLIAALFALDMGLSTTLNRELARLGSGPEATARRRDLLRTLEYIYGAISLLIALAMFGAAPWISSNWLNAQSLTYDQTVTALRLMGLTLMLRWPVPLYTGALMGLQRHDIMNLIVGLGATFQGGGAVLVLWLISPTIDSFFLWQVFASAVQIVALVMISWRLIPLARHRPVFSWPELRQVLAFSMGVAGITILSVILTQSDKALLSRILSLEQFGYYSLASTLAGTLLIVATAIYGALFPAFSRLVSQGADDRLSLLYHKGCQLLSALLFPAAWLALLFAPAFLGIYLHDPKIVDATHRLLGLLTVGNALLAVMLPPLALQLACGWTKLSLYKNVIAVFLYVPMLLLMVGWFGATGAALVWIILPLGYVLIEVPIMHRRLLKTEKWRWYIEDILSPLVISGAIIGIARVLLPPSTSALVQVAGALVATAVALGTVAAISPSLRPQLLGIIARRKPA